MFIVAKKNRRNTSTSSGLSNYSKHTFNSKYLDSYNKFGSDTASILTELSNKKPKRMGSITSNKSLTSKASIKKRITKTRHNSSKKLKKKFVKNVKYNSPVKDTRRGEEAKKGNFEKIRKFPTDLKTKSKKKMINGKKNKARNGTRHQINKKNLRTIDAVSSGFEDKIEDDTNSQYVFTVDDNDFSLKKSATVKDLISYQNEMPEEGSSRPFVKGPHKKVGFVLT